MAKGRSIFAVEGFEQEIEPRVRVHDGVGAESALVEKGTLRVLRRTLREEDRSDMRPAGRIGHVGRHYSIRHLRYCSSRHFRHRPSRHHRHLRLPPLHLHPLPGWLLSTGAPILLQTIQCYFPSCLPVESVVAVVAGSAIAVVALH